MFIKTNHKTEEAIYERAFEASSMFYGQKKPENVLEIYRKTGVFLFNDQERVEISDHKMAITNPIKHFMPLNKSTATVSLRDLVSHDKLFRNVDNLDNIEVHLHANSCPNSESTLGYNDYNSGCIHVFNTDQVQHNEREFLKTLAHEIQHAIQHQNDWDLGGSPELFSPSDEHLEFYRKVFRECSQKYGFHKVNEYYKEFNDKYPGVISPVNMYIQATPIEFKVLNTAMDIIQSSHKQTQDINYACLFGEIEAEATAQKINLPLGERIKSHPYSPNVNLIKHGIHRRKDFNTGITYMFSKQVAANIHKEFLKESGKENQLLQNRREAYEI